MIIFPCCNQLIAASRPKIGFLKITYVQIINGKKTETMKMALK